MRFTHETEVAASDEAVWKVLIDVERWPEWTESISSVKRLDPGPLGVGSRFTIKQPQVPPLTWGVTELAPRRSFVWRSSLAGLVRSEAVHELAEAPGGTHIRFVVSQTGVLAPLVGLVQGGTIRRYIAMEAEGIKKAAERASQL